MFCLMQVRIRQRALALKLKPFAVLLHEMLDQLQKRDSYSIFAQPVSAEEVLCVKLITR